jgi:hypothetical protein
LAQPSSQECAHDAKDGRQDKAGWLVRAGMEEFRDHARNEPNDYRPNEAHVTLLFRSLDKHSLALARSAQTP